MTTYRRAPSATNTPWYLESIASPIATPARRASRRSHVRPIVSPGSASSSSHNARSQKTTSGASGRMMITCQHRTVRRRRVEDRREQPRSLAPEPATDEVHQPRRDRRAPITAASRMNTSESRGQVQREQLDGPADHRRDGRSGSSRERRRRPSSRPRRCRARWRGRTAASPGSRSRSAR